MCVSQTRRDPKTAGLPPTKKRDAPGQASNSPRAASLKIDLLEDN
jgi:hypothetical protein